MRAKLAFFRKTVQIHTYFVKQPGGKSVAQVALHWLVQRGIIVIPKSVRKERMEQNIDITEFSLSTKDMEVISKFDVNHGVAVNFEDNQARLALMDAIKI